jgi:hypothetical protein
MRIAVLRATHHQKMKTPVPGREKRHGTVGKAISTMNTIFLIYQLNRNHNYCSMRACSIQLVLTMGKCIFTQNPSPSVGCSRLLVWPLVLVMCFNECTSLPARYSIYNTGSTHSVVSLCCRYPHVIQSFIQSRCLLPGSATVGRIPLRRHRGPFDKTSVVPPHHPHWRLHLTRQCQWE